MIKKINYVLHEESGSGGGGVGYFNINVNPEGLKGAAKDYTVAVTAYRTAREAIGKALNEVLDAWDDSSKGEYQEKVELALKQLDAIEAVLNLNSQNLTKIATYASETETSVRNGVSSISVQG